MGVLEDAIREHLELKRKHGVSDAVISQQEAEALGPARREEPEPEADSEPEAEAEPVVEPDLVEPGAAADPPVEPAPVEPAPPVLEEEEKEAELPEAELPEPEPPEAALPSAGPEAPPAPADQDTALYEPGEVPLPPDDDEPSPDFADEAPDHERLDSEQKPRRDFDFE